MLHIICLSIIQLRKMSLGSSKVMGHQLTHLFCPKKNSNFQFNGFFSHKLYYSSSMSNYHISSDKNQVRIIFDCYTAAINQLKTEKISCRRDMIPLTRKL